MEFHDYIWIQYEKCIHISTNMPSIGSVICDYYCMENLMVSCFKC